MRPEFRWCTAHDAKTCSFAAAQAGSLTPSGPLQPVAVWLQTPEQGSELPTTLKSEEELAKFTVRADTAAQPRVASFRAAPAFTT